jgi:hypothetical protein
MKIFLSHSGPRSRAVAEALSEWLPRVIQAVKPFFSPEIEKGSDWSAVLDAALKDTGFGIICLTPDNLRNHWIHFEAGALFKTQGAMIWTFLHGINHGDVEQPLGKYQHTVAEKEDVFRLLTSINGRLAEPLPPAILKDAFEKNWQELAEDLKAAESKGDLAENPRKDRDILLEILETVRSQQRTISSTSLFDVFRNSWSAPPGTVSYVRFILQDGHISDELVGKIHLEIQKNYPSASQTFDKFGDMPCFNLFFREPTTSTAVRDIADIIEKITGVGSVDAKIMRATSRLST